MGSAREWVSAETGVRQGLGSARDWAPPGTGLRASESTTPRQWLTRLRNELYRHSFQALLALSCGPAKCECCLASETVFIYGLRWGLE